MRTFYVFVFEYRCGFLNKDRNIKLYGGSYIGIPVPMLNKGKRRLDLGPGFYLTSDFSQAEKWARLKTLRESSGMPIVTQYEFDDWALEALNVLSFEGADREWLEYIRSNRMGEISMNYGLFGIVIGPVVDDQTMPVLRGFKNGVYTIDETLSRLLPQKLKDQYVFKTEAALKYLHFDKEIPV